MQIDLKRARRVGQAATLPVGYRWGSDALEHFEFGKRRAVAAIEDEAGRRRPWRVLGGVLWFLALLFAGAWFMVANNRAGHDAQLRHDRQCVADASAMAQSEVWSAINECVR